MRKIKVQILGQFTFFHYLCIVQNHQLYKVLDLNIGHFVYATFEIKAFINAAPSVVAETPTKVY
nr:MAG TPA: hypothetical protein [Caudoviricetes sp.]